MRCIIDQGNIALNREIAARAAYTNRFEHTWVDNGAGETVCRDCGVWLRGSIGGCSAKAYGASRR